jgi:hypothetical protein
MENEDKKDKKQKGGMKTGLGLWLIGIPLPIILLYFLFSGC